MKMDEIVQELMKHVDDYAIHTVEKIPIGVEPVKKHHKKRIAKKWAKRYGYKTVYKEKPCKKIEVTIPLIIEFCKKENLPLPDELIAMMSYN